MEPLAKTNAGHQSISVHKSWYFVLSIRRTQRRRGIFQSALAFIRFVNIKKKHKMNGQKAVGCCHSCICSRIYEVPLCARNKSHTPKDKHSELLHSAIGECEEALWIQCQQLSTFPVLFQLHECNRTAATSSEYICSARKMPAVDLCVYIACSPVQCKCAVCTGLVTLPHILYSTIYMYTGRTSAEFAKRAYERAAAAATSSVSQPHKATMRNNNNNKRYRWYGTFCSRVDERIVFLCGIFVLFDRICVCCVYILWIVRLSGAAWCDVRLVDCCYLAYFGRKLYIGFSVERFLFILLNAILHLQIFHSIKKQPIGFVITGEGIRNWMDVDGQSVFSVIHISIVVRCWRAIEVAFESKMEDLKHLVSLWQIWFNLKLHGCDSVTHWLNHSANCNNHVRMQFYFSVSDKNCRSKDVAIRECGWIVFRIGRTRNKRRILVDHHEVCANCVINCVHAVARKWNAKAVRNI